VNASTTTERDIWLTLGQAYGARPTITLDEFLKDFMSGQRGKPMMRKTALNQIYARRFPVPIINERILIRDVAHWLYLERAKAA
jgi:hypothetical protein